MMAAITAVRVLRIAAVGIPVHGLPGPALVGESGAEVLVSVSGDDGEPVEHLTAATFHLAEMITHKVTSTGSPDTRASALAVAGLSEPAGGVYALFIRQPNGSSLGRGPHAVVLSVEDGRGGTGRTVMRIDV